MIRTREDVAWLSFWVNFGLAISKITTGFLGYGRLLLMDGVHSAAISIMAMIILIGLRESEMPPDELHRYGHGKAEYMLSAMAGLIITVAGLVLLIISIENLRRGYMGPAEIIGIFVAIISIIINVALYNYISKIGKELNSRVLVKNASNNYLNVIISSIVLLGTIAAISRLSRIEQIAALVISIIILSAGIKIFLGGINGIMDRVSFSQTPQRFHEIKRLVSSVKDIKSIQDVKIRRVGDRDLIDVEVELDENISLMQAHDIAEKAKRKMFKNLGYVKNVSINFKSANV